MSTKKFDTTKKPVRPTLDARTQVLFLSCFDGSSKLDAEDEKLVVSVFQAHFPALKKEAARLTRASRRTAGGFWDAVWTVVLAILLATIAGLIVSSLAGAQQSAEQTMQEASGLESWRQELKAFESRLNAEQKAMWAQLSEADKRVVMSKNLQRLAERDRDAQQGRIDAANRDAAAAREEAQQARRLTYTPVADAPQPKAPYGYDPEHPAVQQQAAQQQAAPRVLTDTQTSQEWIVDRGVFRPVETTHNTYILPAPVVAPARSAATADIDGADMTSWLTIADSASPEIVAALEKSIQQSGQNFAKKLDQLHESAVMAYNVDLYKVATARQTALGWLLLPLLGVLSVSGVYVYRAVHEQRRERLKIDMGITEERRRA